MQEIQYELKMHIPKDASKEEILNDQTLCALISSEEIAHVYIKLQAWMLLEDLDCMDIPIKKLLLYIGNFDHYMKYRDGVWEDNELFYAAILSGNPKILEDLTSESFSHLNEQFWRPYTQRNMQSGCFSIMQDTVCHAILASVSIPMLDWINQNKQHIFFSTPYFDWFTKAAMIGWDAGCIWLYQNFPWILDFRKELDITAKNLSIATLNYLADSKKDFIQTRDDRYLHLGHYIALSSTEKMQWLIKKEPGLLSDSRNPSRLHPMHFAAISGNTAMLDILFEHNKNTLPPADVFGVDIFDYALFSENPAQFNHAMSLSKAPWKKELSVFNTDNIDIRGHFHLPFNLKNYLAILDKSLNENSALTSAGYCFHTECKQKKILKKTADINKKLIDNSLFQESCLKLINIFFLIQQGSGDNKSCFSKLYPDIHFQMFNALFRVIIPKRTHYPSNSGFFRMLENKDYLASLNNEKPGFKIEDIGNLAMVP